MADIAEVILKGACVGQAIYNVLHFKNNGDLAFSDLASDMQVGAPNSLLGAIMTVLCSDYTISSLLCRANIDTTPGPQVEVGLGTTLTGTGGDTAAALPASGVIKWLTAVGGRSGRGRNYFGPLPQESMADGLYTVPDNLTGVINQMKERFTAAGVNYNGNWDFGIWSNVLSAFNPMVDGVRRVEIKTQRRRQLGVGI